MAKTPIYQKCWRCKGDGVAEINSGEGDIVEDPCAVCEGEGYYPVFYLGDSGNQGNNDKKLKDIMDKLKEIKDKLDEA